jgi:sulfopyruvate decarboxylase subunit alpha
MKESAAKLLVKEMKAAGINYVFCLPDSGFREVYFLIKDDPYFNFVPVTNEGEGVAIASGVWIGGKKSIMLMEASGLRVASEALARLMSFGIPVLIMLSYRGSIGDGNWWAINQGVVLEPMLQALRIPYCIIENDEAIDGVLQRARKTLNASQQHVAIIMSGGTLW